ncbi:hypothetical protein SUNI508_10619 [Seiridium unicorne]|uniref:Uncharacterized protein n=1 Tax=Seiridium unicorne TaxID=138068 RepID=A0ABR2UKH7_9PEZI
MSTREQRLKRRNESLDEAAASSNAAATSLGQSNGAQATSAPTTSHQPKRRRTGDDEDSDGEVAGEYHPGPDDDSDYHQEDEDEEEEELEENDPFASSSANPDLDPMQDVSDISDSDFTDTSSVCGDDDIKHHRKMAKDKKTGRVTREERLANYKALLDTLDDNQLSLAGRQLERIEEQERTERKWLDTQEAPLPLDLVPQPTYNALWGEIEETSFQSELAEDQCYQYIGSLGLPSSNNDFLPMWKRIVGYMRCFPTDIIGPQTYLEYAGRAKISVDGASYPDPQWDATFCVRLARIALAGPCRGNPRLVAMFVRYLKACEINDRRRIPLDHGTESRFLHRLCKQLATTDGRRSLPTIHQVVRREMTAEGMSLPWYSDVLRQIEKIAYREDTPPFRANLDELFIHFEPYQVRSPDFVMVERAFNHVHSFLGPGGRLFSNVGDNFRHVISARKFQKPANAAELNHIRQQAYVADKRFREECKLVAESPDDDEESWEGFDSPVISPVVN